MRTLEEQLNEYGAYRAETREPITVTDLSHPSPRLAHPVRKLTLRGWQVGIAAFIVMLLVGALAYEFSRNAPDVAGPTPTTAPAPVTTSPPIDVELPQRFQHSMVGQPAPETTGELIGGGTLDLADLRGERVIVVLWASWCQPCIDHLVRLQDLATDNQHLTVLGIALIGDRVAVGAWMSENDITIPVLDKTGDDSYPQPWDFETIPMTFLIDENGIVSAAFLGTAEDSDLNDLLNAVNWCDRPCASTDSAESRALTPGLVASDENLGNVTLYNSLPGKWVGTLWEESTDGQVIEDSGPQTTETGLYVHDERLLSEFRGIFLIADAKPGEDGATTEMIWSVGLGDGIVHELDQALGRATTQELFFHLHCESTETAWPVVALVGADLTPVQAWALIDLREFVAIAAQTLSCQ